MDRTVLPRQPSADKTVHLPIRYDTAYFHALKSWRDGQLSVAHGKETKKGKTKNKNRVAQKKRSGQKSVKAVWE